MCPCRRAPSRKKSPAPKGEPLFGRKFDVNISDNSFRLAPRPLILFTARQTIEDGGLQCVMGVISVKVWAIVAVVSLGFVGASLANPLDSPGTVYIDGVPCNLPCQSYMAWSRQTLEANQASAKGAANTSAAKTSGETPRKRISKRVEPASADAPFRKKKSGDFQAALTATPEPPPLPRPRTETAPLHVETRDPPAPLTTAPAPTPGSRLRTGHA